LPSYVRYRCARPQHPCARRPHKTAQDRSTTVCKQPADVSRRSSDAAMARPHHGARRTIYPLPGRNTLDDPSATRAGLRGFLETRREATARVASILISSAGILARPEAPPVPDRQSRTPLYKLLSEEPPSSPPACRCEEQSRQHDKLIVVGTRRCQ